MSGDNAPTFFHQPITKPINLLTLQHSTRLDLTIAYAINMKII